MHNGFIVILKSRYSFNFNFNFNLVYFFFNYRVSLVPRGALQIRIRFVRQMSFLPLKQTNKCFSTKEQLLCKFVLFTQRSFFQKLIQKLNLLVLSVLLRFKLYFSGLIFIMIWTQPKLIGPVLNEWYVLDQNYLDGPKSFGYKEGQGMNKFKHKFKSKFRIFSIPL